MSWPDRIRTERSSSTNPVSFMVSRMQNRVGGPALDLYQKICGTGLPGLRRAIRDAKQTILNAQFDLDTVLGATSIMCAMIYMVGGSEGLSSGFAVTVLLRCRRSFSLCSVCSSWGSLATQVASRAIQAVFRAQLPKVTGFSGCASW